MSIEIEDNNNFIVKRPLIFKTIVTGYFKSEVLMELKNDIQNLDGSMKQLIDYLEKSELYPEGDKTIADEVKKLAAQKAVLQLRIQEVEKLKEGDYYVYNMMEGFSQLKIGDDVRKKMAPIEMITKDFIVQSIHE